MKLKDFAALLAFIIGAMAVFAGGQVIFLGKQMDYYVINWLPYYNFTMGVLTVAVTSVLIWKQARVAWSASVLTFSAHVVVMAVLLTAYRQVVASDSLRAMSIRIVAWVLILIMLHFSNKRQVQA